MISKMNTYKEKKKNKLEKTISSFLLMNKNKEKS